MPNSLAGETSPYLLQHADNPVDWYPWNDAALEKARAENKPILLSIGYSACHWCHVMAHESFEDDATAQLMNQHFVNIKVDREERPDLDKIYQSSHQLLTRRNGGWPLTMFLTADDLTPFFGGTYFPLEPRLGMPAFKDVLLRVVDFLHEHRDDIRRQNESLVAALANVESKSGTAEPITADPLREARDMLLRALDKNHGGFGGAPKFPHPTNLERLLRAYALGRSDARPDDTALEAAAFTLAKMALGGIYDQLGGGFCRYSVDEYWMIPHFEKMLYDNGPLLVLLTQACQITKEPLFKRAAAETAGWVVREMQAPQGGYYSSLDADSEGEEGKYYVWDRTEVESVLSLDAYPLFAKRFGLDRAPNFENKSWHLHVFTSEPELAATFSTTTEAVTATIDAARAELFAHREQRIRPGLDDKILTSWNGLTIKGMALAGRVLNEESFVASAERAMVFARRTLWQEGRLLATCKDGRAHLRGYLDDYAFMIDAALALLEARWDGDDLAFAVSLADVLLEKFEDRENGGFYFTAHDHEALIHRPKPMTDDALPAGNGVAAQVLLRLGHLLGETRYLDAAERTLRSTWDGISQAPHAHGALLNAVEDYVHPPQTVVLRGVEPALRKWRSRASTHYAPRRLTVAIPNDAKSLPGVLAERSPRGDAVAYICEGQRCGSPITNLEKLEEALTAIESSPHQSASE